MYHLQKQSYDERYMREFIDSLYSNLGTYMTYKFVDIYVE